MPTLWESRFNNHALWPLVDQVNGQLQDLVTPTDVDGSDALARLYWVVELLRAHHENEDGQSYTPTMLDNVQRALAGNVQVQIGQYLADPDANVAYLRSAADQIDTVLDQMGSWPGLTPRGQAQAAGRAYARYVEATKSALESLSTERDELSAAVQQIHQEVESERAALQQAKASFEETSDAQVKAHLEELTGRYQDVVADSVDSVQRSAAQAQEQKAKIVALTEQGSNIVAVVAQKAVADDYRKNARNKSIAGWIWDLAGLGVGGVPLILLLVHFFNVEPAAGTTSASLTLSRVGISIAAVGLAALCFRRGTSNHKEARRAKRADLRLSTVHPFIANQDPEFQRAVLEGMADRIYLQGMLDDAEADADPTILEAALVRVRQREKDDEQA